jgi:hypothetical protein
MDAYDFQCSTWGGSWGGNLEVEANITIGGQDISKLLNTTITGTSIPNITISAQLQNDLFRAVCYKESTYRQFNNQGWTLRNDQDRGLMQINSRWGNIRIYSWSWLENIAKGISLLNANYSQSITHVGNIQSTYPNVRNLNIDEHWNNALSIYNTGDYYYVLNANHDDWIPNPNNTIGVNYANTVRSFEQSKPW